MSRGWCHRPMGQGIRSTNTTDPVDPGRRNAIRRSRLGDQLVAIRGADGSDDLELHPEWCRLVLDAPQARPQPIHQERADPQLGVGPRRDHLAATIRDRSAWPSSDVVVLGQEADGCRRLRVGPGRVRQVEQLPAGRRAEGDQPGSQPLEHAAETGQPAPGLHVHRRCRSERTEVSQHQAPRCHPPRGWLGPATCRVARMRGPGPLPEPARGRLDERQQERRGVRQRRGVRGREALGEHRSELGSRAWTLGHELPRPAPSRVRGRSPGGEDASEGTARAIHPLEHGPDERDRGRVRRPRSRDGWWRDAAAPAPSRDARAGRTARRGQGPRCASRAHT